MWDELRYVAVRPATYSLRLELLFNLRDCRARLLTFDLAEIRPYQRKRRLRIGAATRPPRPHTIAVRSIHAPRSERRCTERREHFWNYSAAGLRNAQEQLVVVRPRLGALGDRAAFTIEKARGPRE